MRLNNLFVSVVGVLMLIAPAGCRSAPNVPAPGVREHVYVRAAVAADHPIASQAGLEMLKRGGNAVDAAVAVSFCLSVVRPYSCGIGGGGFMLIYMPTKDGQEARCIGINYRETCPSAIDRDYFVKRNDKNASRWGGSAVAVPGTVAGLTHALEKYGTMDLKTVMEPAIRAAQTGFPADANFVAAMEEASETVRQHPDIQIDPFSWFNFRAKYRVGHWISNQYQANVLTRIAMNGGKEFYEGDPVWGIIQSVKDYGGKMTEDDLANYRVQEVEPLRGRFRGHTVYSMPPPSSGGIAMQQVFGILDRREAELQNASHNSTDYIHLVSEAMKHAFADRSEWLGDPTFVDVPTDRLTSRGYLDQLAHRIDMQHTLSSPFEYGSIVSAENPNPLNDHGTSHFCVIDSGGMAVACTETINLNFGSLVEVSGLGFFLNNQMDDFTTIPGEPNAFGLRQSEKNLPQPGKRPLSSMSPTILVKDGRVVLIAGASGGPRIITAATQAILNCLLFEMTPSQTVSAPRFHHQWMPNVLQFEAGCAESAARDELHSRGHETGAIDVVGQVQMIHITPAGIRAASDPRKGGRPAGY